jgi:3-deoxy-manno-octulosonate cytidylyltransferase (CMP-KDO synthetase)
MVEHVYRRAAATRGVARVLVATDDRRVLEAVRGFGGEAVLTSGSHRSGTDRLAEVAATLDCDLVVNVQGDEPLIAPEAIAEAIAPFATDPTVQMTTLRRRIGALQEFLDPNVVKVVVDRQGDALYFSRAPVPRGRAPAPQLVPACAFKHIGLYVYRRGFLLTLARLEPTPLELAESLEQLRALEHGYRIRTVETTHDSVGVDTPEDLEHVRRLLAGAPTK